MLPNKCDDEAESPYFPFFFNKPTKGIASVDERRAALALLHALIFLQASTVNMPNTRQDPLVSVCFVTAVVSAVVAVLAAPCTAFVPRSNVAGVDL